MTATRWRSAYRRRVPAPLRRPIWILTRGLWRGSLRPQAYRFDEDDLGPGSVEGLPDEVAAAETALEPLWQGLRGRRGADECTPSVLAIRLDLRFDTDGNHFAPTRLRNRTGSYLRADLEGATCVEIGSGATNPFALLVLFALCGAQRVIGIEPVPIQDEAAAAVGAARAAALALTAPVLVFGDRPVDRAAMLERARQFDLEALWAGRLSGLDGSPVELHRGSVYDTGLDDASVDYLFSNSTLEHLVRPDEGVAEIARVVRPGGVTKHFVDGVDHNTYLHPEVDELGFLAFDAGHAMVNGSNRLRPLTVRDRFVEQGFEEVAIEVEHAVPPTAAARTTYAEPWRSMPEEHLAVRRAFLELRRCG